MNALFLTPEVAQSMPILGYIEPLVKSPTIRNAYAAFIWTCIFSVKFCFFAFFKALIRHQRGLIIYYWASVVFTSLAWALCFSEGFVFNRYTSVENVFRTDWYRLSLTLTILVTFVDIVSDILIVSIPIILLRSSRLQFSTKLSIGFFLCLSIFMALCSIIRAAGYMRARTHVPEIIWRTFWQQAEGCIAAMMASITVFRALFMAGSRQSEEGDEPARPKVSWLRSPKRNDEGSKGQDHGHIKLPSIPVATLSGLRSFIRKSSGGGQTQASNAEVTIADSDLDPLEADYHAAIRQ